MFIFCGFLSISVSWELCVVIRFLFFGFGGMKVDSLRYYIGVLRVLANRWALRILLYAYGFGKCLKAQVMREVGVRRSTFYKVLEQLKINGFLNIERGYLELTDKGRKLLDWITYGLNEYYGLENSNLIIIDKKLVKQLYLYASRGSYWLYLRGIITSEEYRRVIGILQEVKKVLRGARCV